MADMQWLLELALVLLLAVTLFHALRLERALGVLRHDRSELEGLINGFNKSTSEADVGIARLHAAANGIGRDLARHSAEAASLKDDLAFLTERAERLADRLDGALRVGHKPERVAELVSAPSPALGDHAGTPALRVASKAERELLRALKMSR